MNDKCNFPSQRVSAAEKSMPAWYQNCIDYVIQQGISCNDRTDTETKLSILHGDIPYEYYRKTLNPYNSKKEKNKNFPAIMRNLDITKDIVRRYISEYIKNNHEFTVTAANPELVLARNNKIKSEVIQLAQQAFVQELQAKMQQAQQQAQAEAQQTGAQPEEIDPSTLIDVEAFVKEFEEKYVDDVTLQGQTVLDFIDSITDSELLYVEAWKDFVTLGECYSYRDTRDGVFIKEIVPVIEAYPVHNGKQFVKNHDMFARRMQMTYQQVIDSYDDFLSDIDREYLKSYYATSKHGNGGEAAVALSKFYPNALDKFGDNRDLVKSQPVSQSQVNSDQIEVWHAVWRGEAKSGILKFQNEAGFIDEMIVDEDFEFDQAVGHISIEWKYEPQVYEGIRIGTRHTGIYPMQARAIAFNRKGELPYNGITELLPYLGKFSIIDIVTPFQVMRNIFAYHREMVIAKNKLLTIIVPRSLMGSDSESMDDAMYRWAADGVFYYDDSEDSNNAKAQNIRGINLSLNSYINDITQLIDSIKDEAREAVDMTPQRYGEIAQSAGKATTNEAISRGSMGSVIIGFIFDKFREKDYNMDMDMSKLAYIDGLDTTFNDKDGKQRFMSIDVNSHVYADYSVSAKNSAIEADKLKDLKSWAFSAAQNGDIDMALAAITGNNITSIKRTIDKFTAIKQKNEEAIRQADAEIKQMDIEGRLKEISLKGEEDRKTEELRYYYELQLAGAETDIAPDLSSNTNPNEVAEINGAYKQSIETDKRNIDKAKLSLDSAKTMISANIENKKLNVKLKELASKERIARTNKNKYDK